jgi:hypothetical protein
MEGHHEGRAAGLRGSILPLTVVFLLVSVGSLLFGMRRHRRGEPVVLGIAGAAIVVAGKFAWNSDAVMFGGLALLVCASLLNTLLARENALFRLRSRLRQKRPLTLHQGARRRLGLKGGENHEAKNRNLQCRMSSL